MRKLIRHSIMLLIWLLPVLTEGSGNVPPYSSPYPQSGYPPSNSAPYPPYGNVPPPGSYPQPGGYTLSPSGYAHSYPGSYPPPPVQGYQPQNYPPHDQSGAGRPYQSTHLNPLNSSRPTNKKQTPTILPAYPFNPVGDAESLKKAMEAAGTDENAIIHVLGKRPSIQRLEIAIRFKTMFGEDLITSLLSETSGLFEYLLVSLLTPLPILYAQHIRETLEGKGDEGVLIEVFCTKSNLEIKIISEAYRAEVGRRLEDDLASHTSGTYKRTLISLYNAARDESMSTNVGAAAQDAQSLLDAGVNQWGTDESVFNKILCQRNYAQLQLIFDEYQKISGVDIEDSLKSEFSGNDKEAFLAIARSVRNTPKFYARCLHNAISGFGTNNKRLVRIAVARSEIDMADIKTEYVHKYAETLADAIAGDSSGDYKKLLLALIGEL